MIRAIKTDTARVHDSQHFDEVFDRSNTSRDVYADRGYASKARSEQLSSKIILEITFNEKGAAQKPLGESQKRRNRRISGQRARVKHIFGALEQMGGKLNRTVGQARANFAMTMMAACYNLKRKVYFNTHDIKAL